MTKKRNKQFLKEKEFKKLEKDLSKNWEAQRNLGYIKLEKPVFNGYRASLVLRKDISNREDAWVFQEILDRFSTTSWWKKNYQKLKKYPKDFNSYPGLFSISERTYSDLKPQLQKWFQEGTYDRCGIRWHYCNVPNFFFETRVEKEYRTHIKVIDEVLLQEEAELDAKYYGSEFRGLRRKEHGAPKKYVKIFNRKFRAQTKKITRDNFLKDEEKEYPLSGRHTAEWSWW